MIFAKCPRDHTLIRDVVSASAFTKHGICSTCKQVYVLWGDTTGRCDYPHEHVFRLAANKAILKELGITIPAAPKAKPKEVAK